MSEKFGILDLLKAVGQDDIKVQFLSACMTQIQKAKGKGNDHRITFVTNQLTANEVMANDPNMIGVICWIPKEGYKRAQQLAAQKK